MVFLANLGHFAHFAQNRPILANYAKIGPKWPILGINERILRKKMHKYPPF